MVGFSNMMKQAQELQGKMSELQAEMEQMEIEGSAGAGLVTIALDGKGAMRRVQIDDSLLKPGEGDILEDLIAAAHNDAKTKMEALLQEKMKGLTGGLPIPPGLKLF